MDIGVIICPGLGFLDVCEFCNYQAACETGFTWIFSLDERVRAGENEATFVEQLL